MFYHGTGSENASRAYTETPMQHVQRTALRKKCMKSTFTLDCGKKARLFPLSVCPFVFAPLFLFVHLSLLSTASFFHVLAKHRSLSLQFIGPMKRKRFVDSFTIPFTKRFWRLERFCSTSSSAIHTFLPSSVP